MSVFLSFTFVDSLIEEQEKEFDSIARAKDWLKGQRESDFVWIEMSNEAGRTIAFNLSDIMEFKL